MHTALLVLGPLMMMQPPSCPCTQRPTPALPSCRIDFHTVDTPESGATSATPPSGAPAISRLTASVRTRLAGSFSVVAGGHNPVSLSEHDTGLQLIEAAKVGGGGVLVQGLVIRVSPNPQLADQQELAAAVGQLFVSRSTPPCHPCIPSRVPLAACLLSLSSPRRSCSRALQP